MTNPCPPDCEFRADPCTVDMPCPFHQHGQWIETLDTRPTQAEVEAKAAEMFGADWKRTAEHEIAEWNAFIGQHLAMAREEVEKQR